MRLTLPVYIEFLKFRSHYIPAMQPLDRASRDDHQVHIVTRHGISNTPEIAGDHKVLLKAGMSVI